MLASTASLELMWPQARRLQIPHKSHVMKDITALLEPSPRSLAQRVRTTTRPSRTASTIANLALWASTARTEPAPASTLLTAPPATTASAVPRLPPRWTAQQAAAARLANSAWLAPPLRMSVLSAHTTLTPACQNACTALAATCAMAPTRQHTLSAHRAVTAQPSLRAMLAQPTSLTVPQEPTADSPGSTKRSGAPSAPQDATAWVAVPPQTACVTLDSCVLEERLSLTHLQRMTSPPTCQVSVLKVTSVHLDRTTLNRVARAHIKMKLVNQPVNRAQLANTVIRKVSMLLSSPPRIVMKVTIVQVQLQWKNLEKRVTTVKCVPQNSIVRQPRLKSYLAQLALSTIDQAFTTVRPVLPDITAQKARKNQSSAHPPCTVKQVWPSAPTAQTATTPLSTALKKRSNVDHALCPSGAKMERCRGRVWLAISVILGRCRRMIRLSFAR